MTANHEQRFIAAIEGLELSHRDISEILSGLENWLAHLTDDLATHSLSCAIWQQHSPLAKHVLAINAGLQTSMQDWTRQWEALEPAHELADTFNDKVMLLVFGKFNAGKSSFCNFLAERMAVHGKALRYFRISNGCITEVADAFKEGATETTAQAQGIILGETLVLLDTPGLHSITLENSAITQRITDSADGVLWLSSSTSPGQVQELDELARELHRNKPLLPLVTRSDVIDEDEVDGKIQKILRNKTTENRSLQENDVSVRALEKLVSMGLDPSLLKQPISISTHVARTQGQTAQAMEEAGFERLYAALKDTLEPALLYKQRKPAETLLHHLEENVLHTLNSKILPCLRRLDNALESEQASLEYKKKRIITTAWRTVIPALPELLERHASARDTEAVCRTVTQLLQDAVKHTIKHELSDYDLNLDFSTIKIPLDHDVSYEEITVDIGTPTDHNPTDESTTELATQTHGIGISHDRLYAALHTTVQTILENLADNVMEKCRSHIVQIASESKRLQDLLTAQTLHLEAIKQALRT
ncbi:GTPase [Eoetvoesiella caeni]|uniref:50S ribosome-binding GTPase n=1 Tax=Eoetvoesiella caeni TaxID=645616 RepID=A0A366H4F8_9BURK|nr:GTPase [Eoetvoesiella caeni]MCI2810637.1 50S ribosome-binding GTPase [Eoetvoesiella caeni]NYT56579.1 50S ribosome-binding GTPase [Eoetvoesiella caeni]RBP36260.1 50S ribosome-binding GTPase [Eoetvoesiella caeni]